VKASLAEIVQLKRAEEQMRTILERRYCTCGKPLPKIREHECLSCTNRRLAHARRETLRDHR
jgi:hypothetical protein